MPSVYLKKSKPEFVIDIRRNKKGSKGEGEGIQTSERNIISGKSGSFA